MKSLTFTKHMKSTLLSKITVPLVSLRNSSISECSCSQSIAGDGVACDINTLTVSHNGRLWIGTNNTSTPFASDSAFGHNETNCIIKENMSSLLFYHSRYFFNE